MRFSRRDWFKSAGAASALPLTLWGSGPLAASPLPNSNEAAHYAAESLACDIVVAGGGLAGVCAALAAARNGARVVLIQDRSRLGGNASSEIRMHVLGANSHSPLQRWRETGVIEELKLLDAAFNQQRSFETWDLLLYDKVVSEPNIALWLDTSVIGARVSRGQIREVTAISPLLEMGLKVEARYFIDCTGDSSLAYHAGAEIMRGREASHTYGESLAPEQSDLKTMGNSILFFSRNYERAMPFLKPAWAKTYSEEDFIHRPIRSWEYGYWWIEWGGEMDTIADNRQIRHELLSMVLGIWDYIKNSGRFPESATWALQWVGMIPGKRESRRVRGEHVLTQQEVEAAELFPDRVAYGGWPMDDHPPCGMGCPSQQPFRSIKLKQPYSIPLRSLYSRNITNLFMAGRNISASHVAFSSSRVMATCAAVGQAAGTAAAFCMEKECLPRDLGERVQELQQRLLRDDQSLLGVANEDRKDLAHQATVHASGATPDGPAEAVIDGWNRDIGDGEPHQWQCRMEQDGVWIELSWSSEQLLGQVQITFDTGLHRKLFITGQDSEYAQQIRAPQPETVADYAVSVFSQGRWFTVATNRNNILRMVRHRFHAVQASRLRVHIQRTNGDELARIFEIRAYHS